MGNPRSREPASEPRRTRRSLVELTEAATRAAGDAVLAPGPIGSARDDAPPDAAVPARLAAADQPAAARRKQSHRPAGGNVSTDAPSVEISPRLDQDGTGAARADVASERTGMRDRASRDPAIADSSAELAVNMAKVCQAAALDNIKLGLNAALECAAELASGRAPSDDGLKAPELASPGAPSALAAAADYRAEAFNLMKANMATTFNFTRQLLAAKTSAEFVELSGTHVRTQCELVLQQARVLRSLARTMGKSDG